MGILRVTIGERSLSEGVVEVQGRRDSEATNVAVESAVAFVAEAVSKNNDKHQNRVVSL